MLLSSYLVCIYSFIGTTPLSALKMLWSVLFTSRPKAPWSISLVLVKALAAALFWIICLITILLFFQFSYVLFYIKSFWFRDVFKGDSKFISHTTLSLSKCWSLTKTSLRVLGCPLVSSSLSLIYLFLQLCFFCIKLEEKLTHPLSDMDTMAQWK